MKFFTIFFLPLVLFCVGFDVAAADALKSSNLHECPRGIPSSVCNKRIKFLPYPRIDRSRQDHSYERIARGFGLIKQPRIGRSDPSMTTEETNNKWIHVNPEEYGWFDVNGNEHQRAATNEKEESSIGNADNSLSAQRRDSNAPWAFFVITPNFQSLDQQQEVDSFVSKLGHGSDFAVDE